MFENQYTIAEQYGVYEFSGKHGDDNKLVVVMSANEYSCDKIVNIIMLSTNKHKESIGITIDGTHYYINFGLITFSYRSYLGKKIGVLPKDAIDELEKGLLNHLGIGNLDYKKMYDELLSKVLGGDK